MAYKVKEIFYSLQGEGRQSGRPSVFVRFAGCNLWSGLEKDRHQARCGFCDTDILGVDGPRGGVYNCAADIVSQVRELWPESFLCVSPYVVLTGGEPLLQVDQELILTFKQAGCLLALETNGTLPVPPGLDWICVSPKQGGTLVQKSGDELKVVFPQPGLDPERFLGLDFRFFYVQPRAGQDYQKNLEQSIAYCLHHPVWALSTQLHKSLGLK